MAIQTLDSVEHKGVVNARVRVTDPRTRDGAYVCYEVYCDHCDEFSAGLSQYEAEDVFREHISRCANKPHREVTVAADRL